MENEKPKRGGGRPPLPEDRKLIKRSMHLSREQWTHVDETGMDNLRDVIDRDIAKYRRAKAREDLDE
jgi:hypothetical protein